MINQLNYLLIAFAHVIAAERKALKPAKYRTLSPTEGNLTRHDVANSIEHECRSKDKNHVIDYHF